MCEESIWEDWECHYKKRSIDVDAICKDGIVDQEVFCKERTRILFIGKETNDWKGGDMRDLARRGPRHSYLWNLSRWSYGLLHNFPEFADINKKDLLNSTLKRIALINLKKTTGGASSNMTIISSYAKNDKILLKRQIKEINPNVIVTLGTHEVVLWLLDLEVSVDSPNKEPYYSKRNNALIIPWKHPSMRGDVKTAYENLRGFVEKNLPLNEKNS